MTSVAIAELKAHLSAELKKVKAGESILVLEHRRPVARIVPVPESLTAIRKAKRAPSWLAYEPLMNADPLDALAAERADAW